MRGWLVWLIGSLDGFGFLLGLNGSLIEPIVAIPANEIVISLLF